MKLRKACESVGWLNSVGPLATSPQTTPRELVEWSLMDSAPRRGEVVLLKLREHSGFIFARWGSDYIGRRGWLSGYTGEDLLGGEPTHWMPLPPAPPEET